MFVSVSGVQALGIDMHELAMRVLVARVPLDRSGLIGLAQFEAFCSAAIRARQHQQHQQLQSRSGALPRSSTASDKLSGTQSTAASSASTAAAAVASKSGKRLHGGRHSTESLPVPKVTTGKRLSLTGSLGGASRRRSSVESDDGLTKKPLPALHASQSQSSLSVVRHLARKEGKQLHWDADDEESVASSRVDDGASTTGGAPSLSGVQLTPIVQKRSLHKHASDAGGADKAGGFDDDDDHHHPEKPAKGVFAGDLDESSDSLFKTPVKPSPSTARGMSPVSPLLADYMFPSVAKPAKPAEPAITAESSILVTKVCACLRARVA